MQSVTPPHNTVVNAGPQKVAIVCQCGNAIISASIVQILCASSHVTSWRTLDDTVPSTGQAAAMR